MIQKLKKIKSYLNENGNILVFYIFMFPVFFGAVGLAVDMSNVASMRSSLQASLDTATQGTLSESQNQTSGKPKFASAAAAKAETLRLYDMNRDGMSNAGRVKEGIPFLKCQTTPASSGATLVKPASNCPFTMTEFKYSTTGGLNGGGYITITVQEKADTLFLKMIGITDLTYSISSTARLTNSYN